MKSVYLGKQVVVHWSVLSPAGMMGQQLGGGTAPHWGLRCPSFLWKPGCFQDTSPWAQEFRGTADLTSLPEARVTKGALSEFLKQRQIFLFKKGCPLAFVVPVEGLFHHILTQRKTCWSCLSALISSVINASPIFPATLFGRGLSFTKLG